MKKVLAVLLFLACLFPARAEAAFSVIQNKHWDDGAGSSSTTSSGNFSGSLVVGRWIQVTVAGCPAFLCAGGVAVKQPTSVTDTQGNTFFKCGEQSATQTYQVSTWFAYIATGGTDSISITFSGSVYSIFGDAYELGGIDPSATCNTSGVSYQASTTAPSTTTAGSVPSGYIVITWCYAGTTTWDSPATGYSTTTYPAAYVTTSGSGTVTISGTESSNIAMCTISALQATVTASGVHDGMMLGLIN